MFETKEEFNTFWQQHNVTSIYQPLLYRT